MYHPNSRCQTLATTFAIDRDLPKAPSSLTMEEKRIQPRLSEPQASALLEIHGMLSEITARLQDLAAQIRSLYEDHVEPVDVNAEVAVQSGVAIPPDDVIERLRQSAT
jgi:hypothetical protein